ncbi:MAG: hypothetical protein Q8R34_00415 [bacterium]|nr:hypothetical protein [bacterium]
MKRVFLAFWVVVFSTSGENNAQILGKESYKEKMTVRVDLDDDSVPETRFLFMAKEAKLSKKERSRGLIKVIDAQFRLQNFRVDDPGVRGRFEIYRLATDTAKIRIVYQEHGYLPSYIGSAWSDYAWPELGVVLRLNYGFSQFIGPTLTENKQFFQIALLEGLGEKMYSLIEKSPDKFAQLISPDTLVKQTNNFFAAIMIMLAFSQNYQTEWQIPARP